MSGRPLLARIRWGDGVVSKAFGRDLRLLGAFARIWMRPLERRPDGSLKRRSVGLSNEEKRIPDDARKSKRRQ